MDEIRGAIVPCEYLSLMNNQKWLIGGTFCNLLLGPGQTQWRCDNLPVYIRLQTEHRGHYHATMLLINRQLPPTEAPIFEASIEFVINDPLMPLEFGWKSPAFTIQCPIDLHALPPEGLFGVPLLLWLRVTNRYGTNGREIASSPVNIIFKRPASPVGQPHDHHHPRPPAVGDPS
jgi:hypothetical protein